MEDSAQSEAGGKRKRVVLDTSKPLPAADYDPDLDDDLPQNKPAKKERKPPAIKRAPRLQYSGQHGADKAIMHARDNGSDTRVIVVTLDWHKLFYADVHETVTAHDWTRRNPYHLCSEGQGLSEVEFMGLFCTASGDPGLGEQIAAKLLESEHNHVVVVDGTRNGDEYARLAAFVGAHFYKLAPGGDNALWKSLPKFPTDRDLRPHFKAWSQTVGKISRIQSNATLRVQMREHWQSVIRDL